MYSFDLRQFINSKLQHTIVYTNAYWKTYIICNLNDSTTLQIFLFCFFFALYLKKIISVVFVRRNFQRLCNKEKNTDWKLIRKTRYIILNYKWFMHFTKIATKKKQACCEIRQYFIGDTSYYAFVRVIFACLCLCLYCVVVSSFLPRFCRT